eukprot:9082477-Alexandrium_andersonii.AAC.1
MSVNALHCLAHLASPCLGAHKWPGVPCSARARSARLAKWSKSMAGVAELGPPVITVSLPTFGWPPRDNN